MKFFEFALRSLGKWVFALVAIIAVFPVLPAFFQNTMGRADDRAGYATGALLVYCLAMVVLTVVGLFVGWFDRRPLRLVGLACLLMVGLMTSVAALAGMYLGLDKTWYLTLRAIPTIVLIGVAIGCFAADWQDQRWQRQRLLGS